MVVVIYFFCCFCKYNLESLMSPLSMMSTDEADSVMDLLSLVCAKAQDLAFLSALRAHLARWVIFYALC